MLHYNIVQRNFINSSKDAFYFPANATISKMYRCQPRIFFCKYLSTISFRIKLASLLSTFLKFFISLLGGFTAEVFPFWSFPACGDTWARNNPKDDNFIRTWNYVITREPKVLLKFTLESVNLEAGRTAGRARFVAAPLAAGWLFGTAFACGKTWLDVGRGRLLFLVSNVDSEKQTPGMKQNDRSRKLAKASDRRLT